MRFFTAALTMLVILILAASGPFGLLTLAAILVLAVGAWMLLDPDDEGAA